MVQPNKISLFSRIVLCRVLKKYIKGINNASSKKECCEIIRKIKDPNVLSAIIKDISIQFQVRKKENIDKLNKSKKWLLENKDRLNVMVIHRDPMRIITNRGSFCDSIEIEGLDLLDIKENGNILIKTKKCNKLMLYYFYGNWRTTNIVLNTYI